MNEWRETFNHYARKYKDLTGRYAYYEHQPGNGNWLVVGTTKLVCEANGCEMGINVEGYKEACSILFGMITAMELNGFEKCDG